MDIAHLKKAKNFKVDTIMPLQVWRSSEKFIVEMLEFKAFSIQANLVFIGLNPCSKISRDTCRCSLVFLFRLDFRKDTYIPRPRAPSHIFFLSCPCSTVTLGLSQFSSIGITSSYISRIGSRAYSNTYGY